MTKDEIEKKMNEAESPLAKEIDRLAGLAEIDAAREIRTDKLAKKHNVTVAELLRAVKKRREEIQAAKHVGALGDDASPYEATSGGFFLNLGGGTKPLSDFTARIEVFRPLDDGTECDKDTQLLIQGEWRGKPLPLVRVASSEFPSLAWVDRAWPWVTIYAGNAVHDHLRVAIKLHRRDEARTEPVFTHTGWTQLDGKRAYLHAAGAITADGMRTDVCVEPGGRAGEAERDRLQRFRLRLPKDDEELRTACRASLGVLDLSADKGVTVPVFAMTYLAPLGIFVPLRFTGYQVGPTGCFKTSLAALGQAHYGDFSLDCLPLNFDHGTRVGAEIVLFTMKDALTVADDFLRTGTHQEVQNRRKVLSFIIRAVGNQTSGARGTKDLTLRRGMPPRGLPLVTAETKEVGHSSNARVLFSQVRPGDLPREKIFAAGSEANRRILPLAMGAYVQWIAQNWAALAHTLPKRLDELTAEFANLGTHARQPGNAALVMIGMETALAFMVEMGAIGPEAALARRDEARAALKRLTIEQGEALREEDPARIFVQLLRSGVQAGQGYFETIEGGEPTNASALGWVKQPVRVPNDQRGYDEFDKLVRPKTDRVGFVDEKDQRLFLVEDNALQLVHRLYRDTRHGDFPVDASTLWDTMADRRWIDSTKEGDVRRPRVRARIPALGHDTAQGSKGSKRSWFMALRLDVFEGQAIQSRASGGDSGDSAMPSEFSTLEGGEGCPQQGEKTNTPEDACARVIDDIFADCREFDTTLKVEDGKLVILGYPPDGLKARIREHQAEIIARLKDLGGEFPAA